MLYLKYRPQTIQELDLPSVRLRIEKILNGPIIPHALLFYGPKGTGKTSSARIIAKVINCTNNRLGNKKYKTLEPCNKCSICKSITNGTSPDIIEIDGASNRKIDDIRELISSIRFTPLISRSKIYIIDEVHMLTKEAFNALLKTLEEPPKNCYFFLATTEPDQLPKTIKSRCIAVDFAKPQANDILLQLKRIVKAEKINIDTKVLEFIAKHCDSSFRDSAKILDELILYPKRSIDDVCTILNIPENETQFLQFLSQKDQENSLTYLHNYEKKAGDFKQLIKNVLTVLHDELLIACKADQENTSIYSLSISDIVFLMKLLQEAYRQMKYTPMDLLPVEIAVIEYCRKS